MNNRLEEDMLIRHMDMRRSAPVHVSGEPVARLAITIEHMDGTEYEVNVSDRKETPEHLTALLAAVARGANLMFRALDILRAVGYVDMHPLALPGRHIVFGLGRVALEVEIIEHIDGEVDCGISVSGMDQEKIEEIGSTLEENGIDVV